MKQSSWFVWIAFIVVAGSGWGLWIHDKLIDQEAHRPSSTAADHLNISPFSPDKWPMTGLPNKNSWQEYMSVREKVLRDNPDLAAEYNELQSEVGVQREKLNAAMIQVDPRAAPIIAKLEAVRLRMVGNPSASFLNQASPAPSLTK